MTFSVGGLPPSVDDGDVTTPPIDQTDRDTPSPTSTEPSLLFRPRISTTTNKNATKDRGSNLLLSAGQDEKSEGEVRSGVGQFGVQNRPRGGQRLDVKSDQPTVKSRMKRSIGVDDNKDDDEINHDSDKIHVQKFAFEELMDRAKRLIARWSTSDEETKQRRQINFNEPDDVIYSLIYVSISYGRPIHA
jgi:hypothetical protein